VLAIIDRARRSGATAAAHWHQRSRAGATGFFCGLGARGPARDGQGPQRCVRGRPPAGGIQRRRGWPRSNSPLLHRYRYARDRRPARRQQREHASEPAPGHSGAASFAEASSPRDEIFALAFNEDVYPVLPPTAPFTNDSTVLRAALEHHVSARGRTALYDAITTGVDYLSRGTRERKVLVVLSDGGDNASHATQEASVCRALASNAVIYTIALIIPGVGDANPTLLKELAQASGGESFRPDGPSEISGALGQIARDIRHTYTIGYTSTNTAHDGAFRRVRVVVRAPPGRRLLVRSRAGYLAGTTKVEP